MKLENFLWSFTSLVFSFITEYGWKKICRTTEFVENSRFENYFDELKQNIISSEKLKSLKCQTYRCIFYFINSFFMWNPYFSDLFAPFAVFFLFHSTIGHVFFRSNIIYSSTETKTFIERIYRFGTSERWNSKRSACVKNHKLDCQSHNKMKNEIKKTISSLGHEKKMTKLRRFQNFKKILLSIPNAVYISINRMPLLRFQLKTEHLYKQFRYLYDVRAHFYLLNPKTSSSFYLNTFLDVNFFSLYRSQVLSPVKKKKIQYRIQNTCNIVFIVGFIH